MTFEYDAHTAVTPDGDGFAAELDAGWMVGAAINGGYQLSVVGNAIAAVVPGKPDPLVVSAYYLSASTPGPARVVPTVRRMGGSVATVAADLVQGEETRLTVLATFGTLGDGDVATTAEEIELPPVEECVAVPPAMRELVPMTNRFDMRFHPDHVGWAVGAPSGRGVLSAWFRFNDGRDADPLSLLGIVDMLPPVTFDLGKPGWAPTLELTVHVRARPAPGWLKLHHATRNVAGGMFEEDAEIWDSAGRLVAQARQLARLPRPQ